MLFQFKHFEYKITKTLCNKIQKVIWIYSWSLNGESKLAVEGRILKYVFDYLCENIISKIQRYIWIFEINVTKCLKHLSTGYVIKKITE